MTLSIEQTRIVYSGPFAVGDTAPIPFTYANKLHVRVAKNTQMLTQGIDYNVIGQNVTVNIEFTSEDKLVVLRQTPLDNDASFPQEAGFDSEKIADAIDKLTMIVQEQEDSINRSISSSIATAEGAGVIHIPSPNPGKALKWNAEGTDLVNSIYDVDSVIATTTEAVATCISKAQESTTAATTAVNAKNDAVSAQSGAVSAEAGAVAAKNEANTAVSTINQRIESMLAGYTEAQWNALTPAQKAAVPLACIYEE